MNPEVGVANGGTKTMSNWKDVRKELNITSEDEYLIELEKDLIRTMVKLREEQGLSQAELASN